MSLPPNFDQAQAQLELQEKLQQVLEQRQRFPNTIQQGYVYHRGDSIELIPPWRSFDGMEEQEACERDIMTQAGMKWESVPILANRKDVINDEDVKQLLNEWNENGYGLSIAPDGYPHLCGWRTKPCLGLLMIQDPSCFRAREMSAALEAADEKRFPTFDIFSAAVPVPLPPLYSSSHRDVTSLHSLVKASQQAAAELKPEPEPQPLSVAQQFQTPQPLQPINPPFVVLTPEYESELLAIRSGHPRPRTTMMNDTTLLKESQSHQ